MPLSSAISAQAARSPVSWTRDRSVAGCIELAAASEWAGVAPGGGTCTRGASDGLSRARDELAQPSVPTPRRNAAVLALTRPVAPDASCEPDARETQGGGSRGR